jgi:hypothetical protein
LLHIAVAIERHFKQRANGFLVGRDAVEITH